MPLPEYTFRKDFSGGQNDTQSEVNLAIGDASKIRNINIERDGAISKRLGATRQNPVTTFSGECGMVFQFRPSAALTKLLLAHDDEISEWDGVDTFTQLCTGLTVDKLTLPSPFRNRLYLMNESDNPMAYMHDAATQKIYRPGAPTPTGTMVDDSSVAGNIPAGTFFFRVRHIEQFDDTYFGEPHPTAGVSATTGATEGRHITGVPTGPQYSGAGNPDYFIAKRQMERTLIGGDSGGPYYIDGIIADNTTTVYDFVDSDVQLLEKALSPINGNRLPLPRLFPFISIKQRIVGHDPSDVGKIVWSEIDEFGIVSSLMTADNFMYLDIEDHGDAPIAVAKFGEYLVWYCGRSIHVSFIDAGGQGYSRRIGGHKLGFPNPRCVVELPGGHLVWSLKGPYFFSGGNLIFIGEKIEGQIALIAKTSLREMFAIHRTTERRRQVRFIFKESGNKNNFAAVYHYRRVTLSPEGFPTKHAWTFDDGFEAKSGAIVLDPATSVELEYFADYAGKIFREDLGETNDHAARGNIFAIYESRWDDMGVPNIVKQFEEVWVFITGVPPESLSVSWETDFGPGVSGAAVLDTEDPTLARFGTAVFGTAVFAGGIGKVMQFNMGEDGVGAVGRYLKLKIANDAPSQPFTIMGVMYKWSDYRDRDDAVD